ncbi:MAG: hypothetical protein Q8M05_03150 [Rhodoferax sp.]|uniref:hypothetical protein n=1 Tax=Rhodoferax sp. TaxID=50421 RepID=UPI0027303B3F|nr:hypothetical protein [Rhodoferax sp.]MDP1528356.1 hypothetical protein [Rhodoferax sp.]
MARFSIGTAVGEGFGLIKRRPLSVFVWGLLTVLPVAAAMAFMMPMMEAFTGSMVEVVADGETASTGVRESMMAHMMQMQAVMAPLNVVRFVLGVVIYAAVVRAVVRPRDSSFFSLRLSMDEVRVFVVSLALVIGVVVGVILLTLLFVALGAALWQFVGPAKGLVVAVLIIGGILVALLLGGRLGLMVPATVHFRTFAFAEGWKLGKGKSWSLVGLMLVLVLIVIGLEMVIGGIVAGAMFAVMGQGGIDFASLEAGGNPLAGLSDLARANWPWVVVAVAVAAMLHGMLMTILTAPFASVVRQLSAADEAPAEH